MTPTNEASSAPVRRRGAIYVRLSREGEGTKLNDQIAMCQKLADSQGIDVVRIYDADNGVSAFTGSLRDGWNQLLVDVQAGVLDIILAQSEDRFTRQVWEKEMLTLLCAEKGVTWLTVNDGLVDPKTADGEFFSILRGGLARMESRRKSERTLQRNAERRLRGDGPRGGLRPFGFGVPDGTRVVRRLNKTTGEYENHEVTNWDTTKIHPVEAALVRKAYEFLLSRDVDDSSGLSAIKRMFNASGLRTVRGNVWDLPKVEKVLRRGRNAGFEMHASIDPTTGRRAVWPSKVLDADGRQVKGAWETIVDEATYEAAMARLTDPRRALKRPREARYLMSSIAICACGVRMRAAGRAKGEGAYRCGVHQGAAPKEPGVKHVSIRCSDLDDYVSGQVAHALMVAPRSAIPDTDADTLASLHIALGKTNEARTALLDLVEDSGFDRNQVKAKSLLLKAKADVISGQIREIAQANARAEMLAHVTASVMVNDAVDAFGNPSGGQRASFEQAANLHSELVDRFKALPLTQRRALVRGLVDVKIQHGRGVGRIRVWHKVATCLNDPGEQDSGS